MTEETDVDSWGPAMSALNERQRNFVVALYSDAAPSAPGEGSRLAWAARQAGFGNAAGTSNEKTLCVIGCRLAASESIKRAMAEHERAVVRLLRPEAIHEVRLVMRDKKHRDRTRILAAIYDRADPIETKHTVKIEDNRPPSIEATEKVVARIAELARRVRAPGLPAPVPAIIDADFKVVEEKSA